MDILRRIVDGRRTCPYAERIASADTIIVVQPVGKGRKREGKNRKKTTNQQVPKQAGPNRKVSLYKVPTKRKGSKTKPKTEEASRTNQEPERKRAWRVLSATTLSRKGPNELPGGLPPLGLLSWRLISRLICSVTHRTDGPSITESTHLPIRIFDSLVQLGRKQKTWKSGGKERKSGRRFAS